MLRDVAEMQEPSSLVREMKLTVVAKSCVPNALLALRGMRYWSFMPGI